MEFNCSHEVAVLGLSLFVIGLAVAPMVLSPLSEVFESCLGFQLTSLLTRNSFTVANLFT